MKKRRVYVTTIICILLFSSCASIFNSNKSNLKIVTSRPNYVILEKDTVTYLRTENTFILDQDNKPLHITAFNDSLSKTVEINAKNSFAYWLNLYPSWLFWPGLIIDTKTKKRYTYPKTIYINLEDTTNNYLTYIPQDNLYKRNVNILKISPLKPAGYINPSIELSYERITGSRFSTQIMASYLLPSTLIYIGTDVKPNIKGYSVSLEERFYFEKPAPAGFYISSEFNYLRNQYKDVAYFGIEDIYSDTTYNYTNYLDTFGIKKQTFSINFKLGYQIIHKRLSLDFYAGLGFRYKNVTHYDRINPEDKLEIPRHPNIFYITNKEGEYWTVSIPFNFRIGWTF